MKESAQTDNPKFCRFHKIHKHKSGECIHLKDAIKKFIKKEFMKDTPKMKEENKIT